MLTRRWAPWRHCRSPSAGAARYPLHTSLRVALALAVSFLLGACRPAPETGGPNGDAAAATAQPSDLLAAAPPPTELNAGEAVQRRILDEEVHEFVVVVERDDFFEFRVDQRGVDVVVHLSDPRGRQILTMDLPTADLGPEIVMTVAERPGAHRIEVRAWEDKEPGGEYLATLVTRRRARSTDRLRAKALELFVAGRRFAKARAFEQAVARFQEALSFSRQAGDELWQAETLDRMGAVLARLGDLSAAEERLEEAAAIFSRLDEPKLAAVNANRLAEVKFDLAKLDEALRQHAQTRELRKRLGDTGGAGMSLTSMANVFKVKGESQQALDHFHQALEELHRPEDLRNRATALHDLGTLYRRLGKPEEALERLREAQRIYARTGEKRKQAASLSQIGELAFEADDFERALRTLEHSLSLRREKGGPPEQAASLRKIGRVLLAQGDIAGARRSYAQALELLGAAGEPRSRAAVLAGLGHLGNATGDAEEGLARYRESLAVFETVGDPVGQATALLGMAASERIRGRPAAALEPAARALEIVETVRVKALSDALRLSYFSTAQRYFDFNIDLLMDLDRLVPAAGHAATALQVAERARARSLLDLLSEAQAEIRDDTAPELLAEERRMQQLLNRSVERMEDETQRDRAPDAATRDVRQGLDDLDRIRTAIRRHSPRYAALTQPRTLTLEAIQHQLLDEETLLLQYRLGEERSFLWLVGRDSFSSFELGPRPQLEKLVREAHSLLASSWRRENTGRTRSLLCELSRLLLRPAAGRLENKRLAIVADGALEYLPFAVLPDPDGPGECAEQPLVVAHEIARLPSASTLAVLRREAASRPPASGQVAVVADPVFGADDPRVGETLIAAAKPAEGEPVVLRGGDADAPRGYRRLSHSRAEADAILGLVPSDQAFRALDFDASKETVLSGRLTGYRTVHFATHGTLDAERPALSEVVLSLVDHQGRSVEGVLRAHEIFNLRLPAELVVLAGCRTALGKEVRGEGLVGLARGFMYAGASRVMVSLWDVSDRGTADLMRSFYSGMLQEGLPPAAALRRAQLEARARRPQPFYWAGFVVLGDWRGAE